MTRVSTRLALVGAVVLLASVSAIGAEPITGLPPYGSFSGGPFDRVNNANLNVYFSIPVLAKAGRGLPFNYLQTYNTWFWAPSGGAWYKLQHQGWPGVTEALLGKVTVAQTQGSCTSGGQNYFYNIYQHWNYERPDGTIAVPDQSFKVSDQSTTTPCTGGPAYSGTVTAQDGSGFTLAVTAQPSATVYSRSGTTISAPLNGGDDPGSLVDSNGNQITATVSSSTTLTDTLGTTALTASGSGTPSSPRTYTYTPAAGGSAQVTVNYTAYTVQTNFGCTGVSEYGPTSNNLVSSVSLPDGTSYSFTYEVTPGDTHTPHYVTGRLASVTLPTGGQITYSYTGGNNGIICADGSAAGLTRVTPDGTWTYTRSGSDPAWTTTITDPAGNQTVLNFQGIYETERQVYQGSTSGTLLDTVYTCYNSAAYPCNSTTITLPITQIAATNSWASGQTSQTVTSYNTYGLVTEVDEYGNGSGSPGGLVRKELITYASLGNNINDRVASITIQNGSGGTVQSTSNTYGNTVTATSGTPQHVSISGDRGNLISTTTASLTRNFTYFDTGVVQTATDTNSNTTSYTVSACGNSFATSISLPLSLSRSATWNCNGAGSKASDTDENGRVTSYSYDSMNRLTQTTFADGGWKLTNYTSATQQDVYTGITDTTPSTSCTGCRHDEVVLDGLGRVTSNIILNDPAGATTVATTYDSLGRVYTTSNPYRSTSDPTYGLDTRAYDALSRVTSITHQDSNAVSIYYGANVGTHGGAGTQLCASGTYGLGYPKLTVDEMGMKHQGWTDGLGREIEADEADSSNNMTLGTCYAYDALNDLTSVAQGGQTRSYTYDGVPRKTAETTPEAGTTNFYYTTSGGGLCSGNPQRVCRQTDARNITITYSYDALNRLTSKTYSDTTPAASFYYDESSLTLNGTNYTLTNTKARLSHTSGASATAITIHSYDAMSRTQDLWECTPYNCSSATIWNMHYNYDLAGDVTSYTHPASFTITNTVSHAQRITQITSSLSDSTHPATLAQNISYAPHGAVSSLQNGCAGTGCTQRQETYDYNNRLQPVRIQLGTSGTPNANSCLVYNYYSGVANPTSCAVPSQATSGNDGSVMGHYFQDTTNSSLGHTASYTYDNMMRLATSVATGSATHNLTFSYDRYGNMTCVVNGQTVGPCPSFGFSASTNQITNSNYTYDAAGNLTQDGTGTGTHTYQWDAENRMKSVDTGTTASYTYNALGQRVEKNVGSAYTEFMFDASGEPVGENNRTSWSVSVVSFGGRHLAHYQSSATYFLHGNRLGSTSQATDYTGAMSQDQLYYPWGGDWSMVGTSQEKRFASLRHRDGTNITETGLDPTHFRMFSSTQGRWFSADPVHGRPCTPQSFNRYAYVQNSPTNLTDPRGDLLPGCDPNCAYFWFNLGNPDVCPSWCPPSIIIPIPYGGGGGGGGGTTGGSSPPPSPPPPNICDCYKTFGFYRWFGCSYICSCTGGISRKFLKCAIYDLNAWEPCPDYVQYENGLLVFPVPFCGPPLLPPAPRPIPVPPPLPIPPPIPI